MWLYRLNGILRPLGSVYFSFRARGLETIPSTGPLLLAVNHCSFLDPWLLACIVRKRRLRFLINERWYHRSAAWTRLFDAWGVLPASKHRPERTVLHVVEALEEGHAVAVFPEGKISANGLISRGRVGIGWMAALSGVPALPCALLGSFQVLPKHRRIPRPAPVELRVGEFIEFPRGEGPPDLEQVHAFVTRVMKEICHLADQAERTPEATPRLPSMDLGRILRREETGKWSLPPELEELR